MKWIIMRLPQCLFCLLFAFLCLRVRGAMPVPLPDPETGLVRVQYFASRSLYVALSAKASAYECTVAKTALLPRANNGFVKGAVTLSVERTLLGKECKQLNLPCEFLGKKGGLYFIDDDVPIWPDLTDLQRDRHLCVVVVPKTYYAGVPLVHGVDQAASHVFVSDGSADGGFQWVHRIVDLQSLLTGKDRPKVLAALNRAKTDPDAHVRDYATDALADRFVSGARTVPDESLGQDRLLGSLRSDNDVILGSVDEVVSSAEDLKSVHTGRIVLDVRAWLRGSGKSRVTLPYVYERDGVPLHARLLYVWPPVESFRKGQLLLCVFKPGATDRAAAPLAGVNGAASLVWVVPGADDPIVLAVKKVIAMDSDKGAADWAQKLAIGIKAPQPLVRQYCVDAVYSDIGKTHPDAAMAMLTEHLSHAHENHIGPVETSATLGHVMAMAVSTKDPAVVVKAIYSIGLASAAPDNPRWLQSNAVQLLGQLVSQPGAPSASKVFTARERSDMRARLQTPAHPTTPFEEEQKAAVLKWLEATDR